jgi:hypothetical protein
MLKRPEDKIVFFLIGLFFFVPLFSNADTFSDLIVTGSTTLNDTVTNFLQVGENSSSSIQFGNLDTPIGPIPSIIFNSLNSALGEHAGAIIGTALMLQASTSQQIILINNQGEQSGLGIFRDENISFGGLLLSASSENMTNTGIVMGNDTYFTGKLYSVNQETGETTEISTSNNNTAGLNDIAFGLAILTFINSVMLTGFIWSAVGPKKK